MSDETPDNVDATPVVDPQTTAQAEDAVAEEPVETVAEGEETVPTAEVEPEAVADEPEAVADEPEAVADEPEAAVDPTEVAADDQSAAEADLPIEALVEGTASAPLTATETPRRVIPSRRRDRKRDPNEPKPVVRAQAKYVRSSARKARLVCDNFRGKSVDEARAILAVTPRHVARDWSKLLESAVANAEHNHELVGEDLFVVSVQADEGPTIKRFRPRAQGRATQIRKRTAHLTILLTPKD
jgi:ribosomal protein L22